MIMSELLNKLQQLKKLLGLAGWQYQWLRRATLYSSA